MDTNISLGLDVDLGDVAAEGLDGEAESKDPESAEMEEDDVDAALAEARDLDNDIDAMVGSLDGDSLDFDSRLPDEGARTLWEAQSARSRLCLSR